MDLLKKRNNGFGPLSRKRDEIVFYRVGIAVVVVFVILEAVIRLRTSLFSQPGLATGYIKPFEFQNLHTEVMHLLAVYCAIGSSLVLGEIVRRLTLSVEELQHANERYDGSKWKAFKKCMDFGDKTKVVYSVFGMATMYFVCYCWIKKNIEFFPLHIYATLAICSSIFMYVIGAKKLSTAELSHLTETENKNIADGLAWIYYYGFLKLVLPHMKETIGKAVAPEFMIDNLDMKDAIKAKKIFIIISKHCNCYGGLTEVDPDNIQCVGKLPSFYMSRAGIEMRAYQQSLYRVTPKSDNTKPPTYIIMEYATPLLSMNDMSNDNNAGFSKEDRDTQVVAFYNKLKDILDRDEEIKDRYQLILISDVYENLSDVIYNAVINAGREAHRIN